MKSNPLSTRFVQPGRIPWLAVDAEHSLDHLTDYFTCKLNWRAAIVGPHGSGKSTLLEHLVPRLGQLVHKVATYELPPDAQPPNSIAASPGQRAIVWIKLRGRSESVKLLARQRAVWRQRNTLLVVDGYEQLPMLSRVRLILTTARSAVGLLLTSHRQTFLPTLVKTKVDAQLARELLNGLLPEDLPSRAQATDVERLSQLLAVHQGNLREVFMQLYDEL